MNKTSTNTNNKNSDKNKNTFLVHRSCDLKTSVKIDITGIYGRIITTTTTTNKNRNRNRNRNKNISETKNNINNDHHQSLNDNNNTNNYDDGVKELRVLLSILCINQQQTTNIEKDNKRDKQQQQQQQTTSMITMTAASYTRTSSYEKGVSTFNETIEFPVKVKDLPLQSVLEFAIYDGSILSSSSPNKNANMLEKAGLLGFGRIKLFDEYGKFVQGQKQLPLTLLSDENDFNNNNSSSSSTTLDIINSNATPLASNNNNNDEHQRQKQQQQQELIFTEELERFEEQLGSYERGEIPQVSWLDKMTFSRIQEMRKARLEELEEMTGYVELHVEFPTYALPIVFAEVMQQQDNFINQQGGGGGRKLLRQNTMLTRREKNWDNLVWLIDEETGIETQNPSEIMHYELTRSHGREVVDKDLKPNAEEHSRLSIAMSSPSTRKMDLETQNLLWKFRYSLSSDPRALTKFLKSVDWSDKDETKAAIGLMHQWTPIGPAAALELLTPHFKNSDVRSYAVAVLSRADDDEILVYLLQLVQALRYEASDDSFLSRFLISRALSNEVLANFFYWFLVVGFENPSFERRAMATHQMFEQACHDLGPDGTQQWIALKRQGVLIERLTSITVDILNLRGARKVERLRAILTGQGIGTELTYFTHNIPHLLDPLISLTGINAEESFVFKSALSPLKLAFRDVNGTTQNVIFKRGDDCRQDQLCVQLISLIDKLWKRENLDLQLTTYRVLATSTEIGLIEFVKSSAIADILKEHDSLRSYIAIHNPDPNGPSGCTSKSMQNFVKSCAGYSVITYLLGVGDRHLDNLMLTKDGKLFHIDFGYMMGRDPKISPPSIKISKEMVDCLGEFMDDYKRYCIEAYNLLRKPNCVTLILNLFELMADSDLPDLRGDAGSKLEAKFAIDLDDEAASMHFIGEIQRSMNALFDPLFERIHAVAQRMR